MDPDIIGDIRAGYRVTALYLTAGNLDPTPSGVPYARSRLLGGLAGYASAAGRPNHWSHDVLLLGGREVDSYVLAGSQVRVVCTWIDAAAGPDLGDLHRMWHDPGFQAHPLDGRPPYTRTGLIDLIQGVAAFGGVEWWHMHDSTGMTQPHPDHVDHIGAALFTAQACTTNGLTTVARWEYLGYEAQHKAINVAEPWLGLKRAAFNAYRPYDDQLGPGAWDDMMPRQHRRAYFAVGTPWAAPAWPSA